jgi:hypothetical protein
MSQFQWQTIDPNTTSGTALANLLNAGEAALHTQHKGPNRPTYVVPGMQWIDDTDPLLWVVNIFDGVNDVEVGVVNTFASKFSAVVAASSVTYDPSGSNLSATNVQAAIDELDSTKLSKTGGTLSGGLNMGGNILNNLPTPTTANAATRKDYVDDADNLRLSRTGGTMSGVLNMGTSNKITQLADPTNNLDAANKRYADSVGAGTGNNSQNGYRIIGPIMLQWGRDVTSGVGPETIDFKTAFNGNAWTVVATAGANTSDFATVVVWNITSTTFTVRTGSAVNQCNWFAVGLA